MYLCDVRQGKHPTLLGYEALAFQVLNDIPELMQY